MQCDAALGCKAGATQCWGAGAGGHGAGWGQCSAGVQSQVGAMQCGAVLGCSVVQGHEGVMQCNAVLGCRADAMQHWGAGPGGCRAVWVQCSGDVQGGAVQHQSTVQCTAAGHSDGQCSAMQCRDPLRSAVWGLYSGCAVQQPCSAVVMQCSIMQGCSVHCCTAQEARSSRAVQCSGCSVQCSACAVQHQAAAEQCRAQGTEQDGAGCAAKPPRSPPAPFPNNFPSTPAGPPQTDQAAAEIQDL